MTNAEGGIDNVAFGNEYLIDKREKR